MFFDPFNHLYLLQRHYGLVFFFMLEGVMLQCQQHLLLQVISHQYRCQLQFISGDAGAVPEHSEQGGNVLVLSLLPKVLEFEGDLRVFH